VPDTLAGATLESRYNGERAGFVRLADHQVVGVAGVVDDRKAADFGFGVLCEDVELSGFSPRQEDDIHRMGVPRRPGVDDLAGLELAHKVLRAV
jgi:hypothetical protein